MRLLINGQESETAAVSVAELLAGMKLDEAQFLAVSRNGTVVKRTEWASTQLAAGDRIEILTIVGGG